jgi:TM2 domain-containing membrane protein YozV
MNQNLLLTLPGIEAEEMAYIKEATKDFTEEQSNNFVMMYKSKRREPQMILLLALVGFLGFSGIHRFMLNQIGMGVLYFLTFGLCFIGTIVDLINHKSLALEYNKAQIIETASMIKTMGS